MGYIVGIDYGLRRVGLSISDLNKKIAFPLTVVEYKNVKNVFEELKKLIKEKDIEAFVVGLPLRTDGKASQMQEAVKNFVETLEKNFDINIISWDERYTSVIAQNILDDSNVKRKNHKKIIDKLSAQLILQSYLDYMQNSGSGQL